MALAAVTMVYNEPDYVSLWCRHYSQIVGSRNCFILDHGSDDGSTENLLDVNIIRLPRSPMDDIQRAKMVSSFCSDILWDYDAVIYTDVDEFIIVDPRYYDNVFEVVSNSDYQAIYCIGFEVLHTIPNEVDIDLQRPITEQRSWMLFSSALCKPSIMCLPFEWAPGFHSNTSKIFFDHIYLLHLRYFDLKRGLIRLEKTRAMPWADPNAGSHQRMSNEQWISRLELFSTMTRQYNIDIDAYKEPLKSFLFEVKESTVGREAERYKHRLDLFGNGAWPIPERFKGIV